MKGGGIFAIIFIFTIALSSFIESASIKSNENVVYRRYHRRRPPIFANDLYTDEYLEVFHIKSKPPLYSLSDDDVDRIIRCDFNPRLKECEDLHKPIFPDDVPIPETKRTTTTTATPMTTTTTMPANLQTSTAVASSSTTTSTTPVTTTDLPLLPDITTSTSTWRIINDDLFVAEIITSTTSKTPVTTTDLPLLPDIILSNEYSSEIAADNDKKDKNTDDIDEYYTNVDLDNNNEIDNGNDNGKDNENNNDYEDYDDAEDIDADIK